MSFETLRLGSVFKFLSSPVKLYGYSPFSVPARNGLCLPGPLSSHGHSEQPCIAVSVKTKGCFVEYQAIFIAASSFYSAKRGNIQKKYDRVEFQTTHSGWVIRQDFGCKNKYEPLRNLSVDIGSGKGCDCVMW